MRIVSILVFLIGIVIAGTVAYMVTQRLSEQQRQVNDLQGRIQKNVTMVKVAVTKRDLRYGVRLKESDVSFVDWPERNLPANVYRSWDDLFGEKDAKKDPRTVLRAMDKGEIVSARKVTDFGEDAGVASKLQRGMRAFALRVNVSSGVSGFLRPGDKIDIYWTGSAGGQTVSRLILDGVELIAIDQVSDKDAARPTVARTITVSVSPLTVASLAQAQATGNLQMSLRGVEDDTDSGTIEVNQTDLLGDRSAAPAAPVQQKKVCTIKQRIDGNRVDVEVPCPR